LILNVTVLLSSLTTICKPQGICRPHRFEPAVALLAARELPILKVETDALRVRASNTDVIRVLQRNEMPKAIKMLQRALKKCRDGARGAEGGVGKAQGVGAAVEGEGGTKED